MLFMSHWRIGENVSIMGNYECQWHYLALVLASTRSWTHIFCTILKVHYYYGRNINPNQVSFPLLLDEAKLDELAFFFKLIMMSNVVITMKPPTNCNLCSKMRALLANNWIISHKLSEWLKFIELSMVMVLGSVKMKGDYLITWKQCQMFFSVDEGYKP